MITNKEVGKSLDVNVKQIIAGGYGGQRQDLNSLTLITQKDSNMIITGFPGNGYKYSLYGIIGGD